MILCLVIFYLLGGSKATNNTANTTGSTENSSFSKSIMCSFMGKTKATSSEFAELEPKDIPCECEVIIYSRFSIDKLSVINVDEVSLKAVVDLNKPVLLALDREDAYTDWGIILGPDGNAKDAKVLCDFATKNNVSGFIVENLTPRCEFIPFDEKVGKFIIPYIKQLKCNPDFIIGVAVNAYPSSIKCKCMYNFVELNDLVTFYDKRTTTLNACNNKIYNGQTPITKVDHDDNYMLGMEEVASFLKESEICLTKIAYDIELIAVDINNKLPYNTYLQVCRGGLNMSSSCVQTTTNYYDKGKFALEQDSGLIVKDMDLDDIKNDCGCSSAFAGFKNIVAGFRGGSVIPCKKFDVQSKEYKLK